MSFHYRQTLGDKIFNTGNYIFILLLSFSILYPFWYLLVLSFSTPEYATTLGLKILPDGVNFKAYTEVLKQDIMATAYFNTVFRSVTGSVLSLVVTSAGAYALSKKRMPCKNFFTAMVVFTMFFSGGLIPTYILIKGLHMINTMWVLIIPNLISAFSLIIIRNYMSSLSDSLEESARIDGANDIIILFRIILPMCIPVIATVFLWTIVGHWNSWFDSYIYANQKRLMVLQLLLRRVIIENDIDNVFNADYAYRVKSARTYTDDTLKAATLFVSMGPIILVYPFIQKYFIKGIMIGSLKG